MAERRRRRRPTRGSQNETASADGTPEKKGDNIFSLVAWALGIAFVFKSFFLDTFWIPSSSMEPTLEVGDFLVVTKWTYGYNRHSLVFDPPIFKGGRLFASSPKRGDVVVFDSTTIGQGGPYTELENGGYHVIKRVVGLPGDHIRLVDGLIEITTQDGETVSFARQEMERVNQIIEVASVSGRTLEELVTQVHYEETNPEGRSYRVRELFDSEGRAFSNGDNYNLTEGAHSRFYPAGVVPQGHVFVMGDNRDQSGDSRASLRSVPMHKIVGRARLVVFSLGESWVPRWDRFFRPIR